MIYKVDSVPLLMVFTQKREEKLLSLSLSHGRNDVHDSISARQRQGTALGLGRERGILSRDIGQFLPSGFD